MKNIIPKIGLGLGILTVIVLAGGIWWQDNIQKQQRIDSLNSEIVKTEKSKKEVVEELGQLKLSDGVVDSEMYKKVAKSYEKLTDLRESGAKTKLFDIKFAEILKLLGDRKYPEVKNKIELLDKDLILAQITPTPKLESTLPVNNSPPPAGYNRQKVSVGGGEYVVDIITVDLTKNKIVVDTASDGDCKQDCPVKSLADYVSRSGGWAGINGPYFCPATYPACTDKKNTFDTLIMNRNKTYFNSDNNVYSSVPAAIFSTTSRFVEKTMDWGRDTGVDSVIAGQPLLVWDGKSRFGGDGDPKKTSIGNRAFLGATGSTAYLGIVRGVSVAQASQVIAEMGIKYAINLDSGGSTAMQVNGKYVYGPGRDTPFGIVVVRR